MEENKKKRLLFVGGDNRQMRAVNRAAESGMTVSVLGVSEETSIKMPDTVQLFDGLSECEKAYDAVVLPLPYTTDVESVNSPLTKRKINISELFGRLPQNTYVLAGKCDNYIRSLAESNSINLIDYFEREELRILNAIPTAEGAVQIAMQEVPYTIHSSRCLIIGNGRIGKILAKMLSGIGAEVSVAVRKRRDAAQAFSFGYRSLETSALYDRICEFDIIFNTVPSLILDSDLLSRTRRTSLVIDLASKPGGVDFEAARKLGIKVIWALSLPGKVAPNTAGDIIGKTILNILDEMEVKN